MSSSRRSHNVALQRYLHSGVRTIEEVRRYLRQRGVREASAEALIAQASCRGALDDGACARLIAEQWARQGYAWSAIRQRLHAKGIAEAILNDTATWLTKHEDDQARAQRLLAQPRWRAADPWRRARTLAAHGFDPDLIEHVVGTADAD